MTEVNLEDLYQMFDGPILGSTCFLDGLKF